MFRTFRSEKYEKKLRKLNNFDKTRVENFEQSLKQEPFIGKQLIYPFFREKKFNGKRLLYLVFNDHNAVFLVTITNKKLQQNEINKIKSNFNTYKEEIIKRINNL